MHIRSIRRALAIAAASLLVFTGLASADIVRADGDSIMPGIQTMVDLGEVAPSAMLTIDVSFELVCGSETHVDVGQTVNLAFLAGSAPSDGRIMSVTPAAIGPVPEGWVSDGQTCPFPAPSVSGASASLVTLRAPTEPNVGYVYTIAYARAVAPAGGDDAGAIRGTTSVSFRLAVVTNTAPALTLPADQTVEGDTAGGWTAVYAGVTATDAEDDPDPAPACSPAAGEVLPLGLTTVSCSVTDSGGLTDSGSFALTIVDTTAPSLVVSGDLAVTTDDPAGTTLAYAPPATADVVDVDPDVSCSPLDGAVIPVGTTTVTCSAADDSGNRRSGSFDVVVTYVATHVALVLWGDPIGEGTTTYAAQRGRSIPIKATLVVDGEVRTVGDVALTITPCGGGTAVVHPMALGGGRWMAVLDTSLLAGSCHTVTAAIDGLAAGSFELDLRGVVPFAAKMRRN